MKIHDITLTLSPSLPIWPGDPPIEMELISSINTGSAANVTRLSLSVHSGTHIDAPRHFLSEGETVESLPLEILIGPAWVVPIPPQVSLISKEVLSQIPFPPHAQRALFKTRNSSLWKQKVGEFQSDFVAISEDGAHWLVEHGIRLVGVDYLSVAPYKMGTPTHQTLLRAGVVIVEGVDLSEVEAGEYELYCLPIKLAGADGAPARVILVEP